MTRAVTRCGPGGHGCPVRQPAGHRRPGGRPRPEDPAGRQHHRWRTGQDRLPTEPGHRLNRSGRPRYGRRDPQEGGPLLHRAAAGAGRSRVPGLPGGAGRLRPPEPDSYGRRPRILRDSGGAVRVLAPATSDRGRTSHPRTAIRYRRLRPSTRILAANAVLAAKVRPRCRWQRQQQPRTVRGRCLAPHLNPAWSTGVAGSSV